MPSLCTLPRGWTVAGSTNSGEAVDDLFGYDYVSGVGAASGNDLLN